MTSQDGIAPITPPLRSSNHRMSWYTAEVKKFNPDIQECSPLLRVPGCTHPQQQLPILILVSRAPRTSPLLNPPSGNIFRELRTVCTVRVVLNDWPPREAVPWKGCTRGQRPLNSPSLPILLQKRLELAHGEAPSSPLLPSTPAFLSSACLISSPSSFLSIPPFQFIASVPPVEHHLPNPFILFYKNKLRDGLI